MNRKILMACMALLAVAMLVTPVMARGPLNAVGKNPNVEIIGDAPSGAPVLDLNLPSGVTKRWFGDEVQALVKPANQFHCPTELDVGDNFVLWLMNENYRGKWVHMNKGAAFPPSGYLGLFTIFDLIAPTDVPEEGVYIWGSAWQ